MIPPFGIKVAAGNLLPKTEEASSLYKELPETTCKHRGCCCSAGCPNMYYVEYVNIRVNFIEKMSKEDRLELLVNCLKYYLKNQFTEENGKKVHAKKPCLLLDKDKKCKVYDTRPLKCRTYGLIPSGLYRWIVTSVSKDAGIDKQDFPLCIQCPFVRINEDDSKKFPSGTLPEKMIQELERKLRRLDIEVGVPKNIQEEGYSFLTFHDWHIMSELGEGWMSTLSVLREKDEESKEQFMDALKEQFRRRAYDGLA